MVCEVRDVNGVTKTVIVPPGIPIACYCGGVSSSHASHYAHVTGHTPCKCKTEQANRPAVLKGRIPHIRPISSRNTRYINQVFR